MVQGGFSLAGFRVEHGDLRRWQSHVDAAIAELKAHLADTNNELTTKVGRYELLQELRQKVSKDDVQQQLSRRVERKEFQQSLEQKADREHVQKQLDAKVSLNCLAHALDQKVGRDEVQQQLGTKVSHEAFQQELARAFQQLHRMLDCAKTGLLALHAQIQQSADKLPQLRRCLSDHTLTVPIRIGPNPEDLAFSPAPSTVSVDDAAARAYVLKGACWSGLIDVSAAQQYQIKALVRCAGDVPATASDLYVAVKCFDANKDEISVFERHRTGSSVKVVGVHGRTLELEHTPDGWCREGPCHCRSLLFFRDGVTDRRPDRVLRNQHDYWSVDAEHGAYSRLDGNMLHLNVDPPLDAIDVGTTRVQNVRGANTYMYPCGSQSPGALRDWKELRADVGPQCLHRFWEGTRYIRLGVVFAGGYDDGQSGPIPGYQLRRLSIE
mmetsp:Transcript_112349/g.328485  ORF Transcript_112349/g.328485 Transcript_112349/m.328485 type:complete len:438 (+) Transcript_112349:101-1414(+)